MIGPNPQQISVAIRIGVPWDQANERHDWNLTLIDEDGRMVIVGKKPIALNGRFEAGRPAGVAPGADLWVPLGINFGAVSLPPGKRYSWRVHINGETSETWNATFSVRP